MTGVLLIVTMTALIASMGIMMDATRTDILIFDRMIAVDVSAILIYRC